MLEKKIKWCTRLMVLGALGQGVLALLSIFAFYVEKTVRNSKGIYTEGVFYAAFCSLLSLTVAISTIYHHIINRGHQRYSYTTFDLSPPQRQLVLLETSSLAYMALLAALYCGIEGWEFDDALYWCVSTLATIGFGDITPKTDTGRILLVLLAPIGIGLIGGFIYAMRQVVLELFTMTLANQFSKEFGLDKEYTKPKNIFSRTMPASASSNIGQSPRRPRRLSEVVRPTTSLTSPTSPSHEEEEVGIKPKRRDTELQAKSAPGMPTPLLQRRSSSPQRNSPPQTAVSFAPSPITRNPPPDANNETYGEPLIRSYTAPSPPSSQHEPIKRTVTITRTITYLGSMISEHAMNQWTVEKKKIARRVDRYERKAELKDYWRKSQIHSDDSTGVVPLRRKRREEEFAQESGVVGVDGGAGVGQQQGGQGSELSWEESSTDSDGSSSGFEAEEFAGIRVVSDGVQDQTQPLGADGEAGMFGPPLTRFSTADPPQPRRGVVRVSLPTSSLPTSHHRFRGGRLKKVFGREDGGGSLLEGIQE
ncbi:Potassium channel, partial [Rhizophlyctis rosea]